VSGWLSIYNSQCGLIGSAGTPIGGMLIRPPEIPYPVQVAGVAPGPDSFHMAFYYNGWFFGGSVTDPTSGIVRGRCSNDGVPEGHSCGWLRVDFKCMV
jgi:hypothetical protein